MKTGFVNSAIWGMLIGEALGIAAQEKSREELKLNPIAFTDTASEFRQISLSSVTMLSVFKSIADYATVELTCEALLEEVASNNSRYPQFIRDKAIYLTTKLILFSIESEDEYTKIEGSDNIFLSIALPYAFVSTNDDVETTFAKLSEVAAITGADVQSILLGTFLVHFIKKVILGDNKYKAFKEASKLMKKFMEDPIKDVAGLLKYDDTESITPFTVDEVLIIREISNFKKLFSLFLPGIDFSEIKSETDSLHCLETVFACLLSTSNFNDAIIKAVNLKGDSAVIGALTGAIGGVIYNSNNLGGEYLKSYPRYSEIQELVDEIDSKIDLSLLRDKTLFRELF